MTTPHDDVVLVTGATGRIGRLVVNELRRAGVRVCALTRRPGVAALPDDVEVVAGDFTDPDSLAPALRGVGAVFLVWTAPLELASAVVARLAEHAPPQRRVIYLSAPFRTPHPFFQQPNPMRDVHAELERLLAHTPLDVCVLRPGMFASNALHWWAPQVRIGDVVRWPYAAAETAPVDERDIAAVAARVLTEARHARGDYVLTGEASLRQDAQVHLIGEAIGRPLRYEEITPEQFQREAEGTWPPGVADMLLGAWKAAVGRPAFVSMSAREILGVPPRSFSQWAADHATVFERPKIPPIASSNIPSDHTRR
jgi:uncharacterized protein YbjT (DUF2867 family)